MVHHRGKLGAVLTRFALTLLGAVTAGYVLYAFATVRW